MIKMVKWPSISQYREVVKNVQHKARFKGLDENDEAIYDPFAKLPTLRFQGTVKLHGCVHKDTLITLADGSKEKIQDIKAGTSILSYNEEKKEIEFDIVNDVIIQNLDKPWIELKFDDGSVLKCTSDHPVLTTEGWVEAKNLTSEHVLITEN